MTCSWTPSVARRRSPSARRPLSGSRTRASRLGWSSTREKFDELTRHLLDRTIELTHDMLAEAKKKGHESFDKIILVGGATRMPQVRDRLVSEFGQEPESYDPDEAVAKGAALFGLRESLQDEVQKIVTPEGDEEGEIGPIGFDGIDEAELERRSTRSNARRVTR